MREKIIYGLTFEVLFNLSGDVIEVIAIVNNTCSTYSYMPMPAGRRIWRCKKLLQLRRLPFQEYSGQARIERNYIK